MLGDFAKYWHEFLKLVPRVNKLIKKLNFFPYYKNLLLEGKKYATIRLPENVSFLKGEIISVTIGWSKEDYFELFKARISSIYTKKIKDLNKKDLAGESPDCISPEAIQYVVSCIYKKIISPNNKVTIIKFEKI